MAEMTENPSVSVQIKIKEREEAAQVQVLIQKEEEVPAPTSNLKEEEAEAQKPLLAAEEAAEAEVRARASRTPSAAEGPKNKFSEPQSEFGTVFLIYFIFLSRNNSHEKNSSPPISIHEPRKLCPGIRSDFRKSAERCQGCAH